MTCPDCHKLASRLCHSPSQQHWSWCAQADALRQRERADALHFLTTNAPTLTALRIPDQPPTFQGVTT